MNATVIAAAVGACAALIVSVVTGWWSGHRENIRWSREKEDREKQWQRERQDRQEQWQREDSLRCHQDRQQAYARLIAALHEWDNELRRAVAIRENDGKFGEERDLDTTEIERRATAARETLPLVQFMAPKTVGTLARSAIGDRDVFLIIGLSRLIDLKNLNAKWTRLLKQRSELLAAMRKNLGLEEIAPGDAES